MTAFAVAVERQQWPLVAVCLLLGVKDAAERLPPQALFELIGLLAGTEEATDGG